MINKIAFICLAVWALLTGLFLVTNIEFENGKFILGLSALVTGVVYGISAIANKK